ncbi:helix-turn-helix transcriptional regulator [Kurthia senegalensis]|uniref:helix-turn-helix transcriptional regulator n=1 Tax=Kurthia senegalensis TaxID=1033740 RepID=UPI00028A2751|nr:AraC family transcriptional regulator [Kurthia senegalensis]
MQIKEIAINELGQEQITYPNPNFPSVVYETVIKQNVATYIPLHWHEDWQFQLMSKGTALLIVNGQRLYLEEGQGIWINSGIIHEVHAVDEGATYHCWNVHPDLLPKPIYTMMEPMLSNHAYQLLDEAMSAYVERCLKEEDPIQIAIYLMKICPFLLRGNLQKNEQRMPRDDRFKKALVYIHHHFKEKITLRQIADCLYLSEGEAVRFFQKQLNVAPMQYVIKYRLEKSREMLQYTDQSVTKISLEVGFSSVSYFIQKFKEMYGMTPKQFQKQTELRIL